MYQITKIRLPEKVGLRLDKGFFGYGTSRTVSIEWPSAAQFSYGLFSVELGESMKVRRAVRGVSLVTGDFDGSQVTYVDRVEHIRKQVTEGRERPKNLCEEIVLPHDYGSYGGVRPQIEALLRHRPDRTGNIYQALTTNPVRRDISADYDGDAISPWIMPNDPRQAVIEGERIHNEEYARLMSSLSVNPGRGRSVGIAGMQENLDYISRMLTESNNLGLRSLYYTRNGVRNEASRRNQPGLAPALAPTHYPDREFLDNSQGVAPISLENIAVTLENSPERDAATTRSYGPPRRTRW